MLKVRNLHFYYSREQVVLNDISFELKNRDILCLLGPNGTGKTTLLRCLLTLNKPRGGGIQIDGADVTRMSARKKARHMAYVPQASSMAFPYQAEEIVLMGRIPHLKMGAGLTTKDREICMEAMECLDITHLRTKTYNSMSGGEQQLVLVARALAQQAQILVMDEPTANLDFSNQVKILQIINKLSEQGYSIVMTTHFPDHAFLACNQVILMRDGLITTSGPPEKVVTSENLSQLYGTDVCVTEAKLYSEDSTTRVCVPIMKKLRVKESI